MLDHLSLGRFELGMGRGSSSTEQSGFGINDPELTKVMFDEVVRQLPRMWEPGTYAYEGEYFRMPERNVLPKPYTLPHPPLWVAAGNPSTFEKARAHGARGCSASPPRAVRTSAATSRSTRTRSATPSRSAAT